MKSHFCHWFSVAFPNCRSGSLTRLPSPNLLTLIAGSCLTAAIALPSPATTLMATDAKPNAIAQALPTPLPPLPTNDGIAPTSGEQYIVLIDGSSDSLLQQVRQVEPGAFVNYVGGRSLIQAGRFSSYQNAQNRANELANFGIGANVQATNYAGTPLAVTSPADYTLTSPNAGIVPPSSPVGTVAATPSSIEFGQAAPFGTAGSPTTATSLPPSGAVPPLSNTVAPPPLNAPTIINESLPSGYYVVVPGDTTELQGIANQVVALGAPSTLVRPRTAPRGPHIAVGPYNDHGIAQEWSNYLRDAGLPGARVHFE